MSNFLSKAASARLVTLSHLLALALAAGGWLWAWLMLGNSSHSLILHFNELSHVNQRGDFSDLSGFAVFALGAIIIDYFIALELESREKFLARILTVSSVGLGLLIFIGFAAIISVN